LCRLCLCVVLVSQDTSKYIATIKFVMPKIAVQERKVSFNDLKNSVTFGVCFRKVAFCVNQNRSEGSLHPHTQRTLKRKDL